MRSVIVCSCRTTEKFAQMSPVDNTIDFGIVNGNI